MSRWILKDFYFIARPSEERHHHPVRVGGRVVSPDLSTNSASDLREFLTQKLESVTEEEFDPSLNDADLRKTFCDFLLEATDEELIETLGQKEFESLAAMGRKAFQKAKAQVTRNQKAADASLRCENMECSPDNLCDRWVNGRHN